ncbi:MAG: hypothetical protein IT427_11520 [Pirellulales bacterium]|nr:hypothetical protein [Pirellulales bacterium]
MSELRHGLAVAVGCRVRSELSKIFGRGMLFGTAGRASDGAGLFMLSHV